MSHIVKIESRVHDRVAIDSACRRLGLTKPIEGTAKLYSGEATGLLLQLPGWTYPAVIEPVTGTIKYDVFGGAWKA